MTEVIEGYERASEKALEMLPSLVTKSISPKDQSEVAHVVRTAVMSKQYGNEDFLAELIEKACSKWKFV